MRSKTLEAKFKREMASKRSKKSRAVGYANEYEDPEVYLDDPPQRRTRPKFQGF